MEEIVNPGSLNELQNKLKKKYPELTDVNLHHTSKKEMLQIIGYKLRKSTDEMLRIIRFL